MSDAEIDQFIIAFKSFMDHASAEELNYLQRESRRKYNLAYHTYMAHELGVTMDYYMSEFNI